MYCSDPEFKVTHRDSFGQAAKDYTQKTLGDTEKGRRSFGTNDVQTNGGQSNSSSQAVAAQDDGTFIAQPVAGAIILDQSNKSKESEAQPVNEIIPANLNYKHSMGSVSFGAQNRLTFEDTSGFDKAANDIYADNDDSGKVGHGSMISIRDIQEVRDKVPASPATRNDVNEDYFH